MDYWDYLAHSRSGAEQGNHRYYARELVGTKGGKNVYRYFYSKDEYAAYQNQKPRAGKGTYAETGKSMEAKVLPKGTLAANSREGHRESIAAQKKEMDTARRKAASAKRVGEKHSMDRKRWASENAKKIGEEHSADRKRWDTEKRAEQVKKDAESYRKKRARTQHQQSVRKQKIRMDAKRTRAKRREAAKKGRDFIKRVLDNTRPRKAYEPKEV